ncbi:hypothetical protein [Pseudomonas guariconensis]|uniref:hypothetical protein n=1 Tax=Pseudomonas guariconensis TaxID=1288410 RepID=UPI0039059BBB
MDTNKMRSELRVSAERAVASNPHGGDGNPFPALAVRAVDVLALLAEIERLATSRSKKERELEQELEVWHHGPFCWTCGDTGDVRDITGEWRGECDCLSAQLINANRERDQLKAENEELRSGRAIRRLTGVEVHEAFNQAYYQLREICSYGEQLRVGVLAVIDASMAKEASHG